MTCIVFPLTDPINASSNPGIKVFEPNLRLWPLASPPSNGSPSTFPLKSITRVSPFFAGLSFIISLVPTFSLAIFSTDLLMSFSLTFTTGLIISKDDKSGI